MTITPRFAVPPGSDHWVLRRVSYNAADMLPVHLRPGGLVRMAMLLHLAQHPDGVSQAELSLVALSACNVMQAPPTESELCTIVGHMATQDLLAMELTAGQHPCYFSPSARKVARIRRMHGYTLPAFIRPARVAA